MQAIFSFILHYRKFFLMAKIVDWDSHIGRRLRLRDLHVFFTVAQHGSLARAASHLGVSHPAVSQLIADLERAVGARLFDRSSRGVSPIDLWMRPAGPRPRRLR